MPRLIYKISLFVYSGENLDKSRPNKLEKEQKRCPVLFVVTNLAAERTGKMSHPFFV